MRYTTFAILVSAITLFRVHKLFILDESLKTEVLKRYYPQEFIKVNKKVKKYLGVKCDEMLKLYYIEMFVPFLFFVFATICLVIHAFNDYDGKLGQNLFLHYVSITGVGDFLTLCPIVIYNRRRVKKIGDS